MRIHDLGVERGDGRVRLSALFTFEAAERAPHRVWVELDDTETGAEPSPDGFLLMGLPLAFWVGEPRVLIEGRCCSALRGNLDEAMRLFESWYAGKRPIPIEATEGFEATRPRDPRRTGLLLSGGVDSLATLITYRERFPEGHPDRIREAYFLRGINGYDFDADGRMEAWRVAAYERQTRRLHELGEAAGFQLTPIDTNVRTLFQEGHALRDVGWAASYIAPVHMLTRRVTDLLISSTSYGTAGPPHASHPMLDPLFSSAALRVHHPLPFELRFEKLALVASWPDALRALDVCLHVKPPVDEEANCGRCGKCIRTMLGLIALGKLEEAPTFPRHDLTAQDVKTVPVHAERHAPFIRPMIEPLCRVGRDDLADALVKIARRLESKHSLRRRTGRWIRGALRGSMSDRAARN